MATQKDGGLVSRAVREALGTLVSPHVYGQLVTRSLHAAGLTEIPESGRALAQWIEGSLSREIETAVGVDAAELVAAQLAPIVAHASAVRAPASPPPARALTPTPVRDVLPMAPITATLVPQRGGRKPASDPSKRRSSKPVKQPTAEGSGASRRDSFGSEQPTGIVRPLKARPARADLVRTARHKLTREQMSALNGAPVADPGHTSRPQASDASAPAVSRVLAASSAHASINALRSYLEGTAEVLQVMDLVGLLDTLDGSGMIDPIVLLDCQRPTVHVTSIAAIGEDLPRGTTIVLWGGSDETWNQIDRERIPSCRWVRCSHEATTDDVGSLCAMLIGATHR